MKPTIFTKNVNKVAITEHIKFLNNLELLRANSLLACNPIYMHANDPTTITNTYCDVYSRKTRKRVQFNTRILFSKVTFLTNPNEYLLKYMDRLI
jgi:hypothetical protein